MQCALARIRDFIAVAGGGNSLGRWTLGLRAMDGSH